MKLHIPLPNQFEPSLKMKFFYIYFLIQIDASPCKIGRKSWSTKQLNQKARQSLITKNTYRFDSPTGGRTILYIPEAELEQNEEQN